MPLVRFPFENISVQSLGRGCTRVSLSPALLAQSVAVEVATESVMLLVTDVIIKTKMINSILL